MAKPGLDRLRADRKHEFLVRQAPRWHHRNRLGKLQAEDFASGQLRTRDHRDRRIGRGVLLGGRGQGDELLLGRRQAFRVADLDHGEDLRQGRCPASRRRRKTPHIAERLEDVVLDLQADLGLARRQLLVELLGLLRIDRRCDRQPLLPGHGQVHAKSSGYEGVFRERGQVRGGKRLLLQHARDPLRFPINTQQRLAHVAVGVQPAGNRQRRQVSQPQGFQNRRDLRAAPLGSTGNDRPDVDESQHRRARDGQPVAHGRKPAGRLLADSCQNSLDLAGAHADHQVLAMKPPRQLGGIAGRLHAIPGPFADLDGFHCRTELLLLLDDPTPRLLSVVAEMDDQPAGQCRRTAAGRKLQLAQERRGRPGEQFHAQIEQFRGGLAAARLFFFSRGANRGLDDRPNRGQQFPHFRLGQKLLGPIGALGVRRTAAGEGDVRQAIGRSDGRQGRLLRRRRQAQRKSQATDRDRTDCQKRADACVASHDSTPLENPGLESH